MGYVMENGCMCCRMDASGSYGNELEQILDHLLLVSRSTIFDYLVIETSGLADPGTIVQVCMELNNTKSFRLDGVVTLMDANSSIRWAGTQSRRITRSMTPQMPIEAQRQLAYADLVVLTKVDLVDDSRRLTTMQNEIIRRYNADVPTEVSSIDAPLAIDRILNIEAFNMDKFVGTLTRVQESEHDKCGQSATKCEIKAKASHSANVSTFHHTDDEPITNGRAFQNWLNALVDEYAKSGILRIKGILYMSGEPCQVILQGVLDTYTLTKGREWRMGELRQNRIVIIGRDLQEAKIRKGFMDCIEVLDRKSK